MITVTVTVKYQYHRQTTSIAVAAASLFELKAMLIVNAITMNMAFIFLRNLQVHFCVYGSWIVLNCE